MDASTLKSRIRFDKFEVNLHSGELRKQGHKIRIQPQPMKVLAILLERPGELVTREELRKRLWPGELYVDFDRGLNRSINKLRRALLDEANSPLYIETLATRGYRFIASVECISACVGTESELSPSQNTTISATESQANILLPDEAPLDASNQPISHERLDDATAAVPITDTLQSHGAWWSVLPANSSQRRRLILTALLVALIFASARDPRHTSAANSMIDPRLRPVPLVTFANGMQWLPAFSPDGSRVAYSLGERPGGWYLEVKDVGTDTRIRLTQKPAAFPPGPAWSPDGRQIAFVRADETDDRGIFIISATGGPERKLRSIAPWYVYQRVVSWSPDGRWIAFADEARLGSAAKPGGRGPNAIYLISPDTFETRQLTQPSPGDYGDAAPTFSPDGATIAFVRQRADSHDELYTIPVAGGTPHMLVTKGLWTNGLTWTADGKEIIFDRSLTGRFRLWRVNASGGEAQPLDIPSNADNVRHPTIWRDRLAYESHELTSTIGRIALNSSHQESFDTPLASTRHERGAKYSPDGKHIAFISDRSGADEMWITDSDGANPVQLTNLNTTLCDLSWVPRGNAIALITDSGKIFLVSLENAPPKLLLEGVPSIDDDRTKIAFSRSGDFLYVLSQPENSLSYDLLKVPMAGGAPSKVMRDALSNFVESTDGKTLFYSMEQAHGGIWNPESDLWKRSVEGGQAQFLVSASLDRWDIGPDSIYILTKHDSIDQYSLDGKYLRTVAKFPHVEAWAPLSISPDGRSALFGYVQRITVEIDMVQGFH